MSMLQVNIDASRLERFAAQLEREAQSGRAGPMRQAFNAAGAVYMAYIRERFHNYSRGMGDWAPLAESTKQKRRNKDKDSIAILVDTALLRNSISQYATDPLKDGVRVGTDVEYARYHQEGGDNLPQREIFVQPDDRTLQRIVGVLEGGLQRSIDMLGGRPNRGA